MPVDPERLREELRRMRVLIEKDPATRNRFDADGNGAIDGDEWEQVRQLVIQRLEREEAEAAMAERLAARAGERIAAAPTLPGAVAQAIHEGDLPASRGSSATPESIGDADEMVLERQGALGALLGRMVRRRYAVFAADGSPLATIEQVENQMIQELTNQSILEFPDLHFRVVEAGNGNTTLFSRSRGLARDCIDVMDPAGRFRAAVEWKFSLLGGKLVVQPAGEGGPVTVKGSIFRPFTLEILDLVDDPIGRIEHGWSGLGAFLTGAHRTRIRVNPGEVSSDQRWGLLAAALLADVEADSHR
jgi:hypothetical protein